MLPQIHPTSEVTKVSAATDSTATGDELHFPGEETEATAEATTLTTSEETEPELAKSQNVMCKKCYCQVKSSTPSHLTTLQRAETNFPLCYRILNES